MVERVATEIDNVCAALIRHGLSDSQPGLVGLERLRKLAQSPFLVSGVPTLPTLVPFLELSNNQDYLVKRIKVLAKGGSMSEFKWNSGGSYNGKPWDSTLPTDTAVKNHIFIHLILILLFYINCEKNCLEINENYSFVDCFDSKKDNVFR